VEGATPNDIRKEEMFKQQIAFNDILPLHKLLLSIGVLPAIVRIRIQRVCNKDPFINEIIPLRRIYLCIFTFLQL
jgi:hypothetical protein